ncbi:MAG: VOC family protein [Candidatus Thermoplasmatota archaeon]|nr:VOC family protein [Candidatus Thermoplasmatota archaeon]
MPEICAILINVTDMDEAIDFYTNKIGFKLAAKDLYPKMVELDHSGAILVLYKVDRKIDVDYPNVTGTVLNIRVDNLEHSMRLLANNGVKMIHDEPQECPVGFFAAFRDPFGNVLELLEFAD